MGFEQPLERKRMREPNANGQHDLLLDVAVAIADGTPVDWDTAQAADSSSNSGSLVVRLQHLERLVRGHEAIRSRPGDVPDGTGHDTVLTQARKAAGAQPLVDVRWGPLVILDKVGRGSFGDVYRAWDPRLEREVALKLVPERTPESVSSPVVEEGRLLARVQHPNVLTVYGAERIDGRVGIWTEFVRGETLAAEIARRGPVTAAEATQIGVEICRALQAVHDAGLLHRDVKAQNILRDATGRLVLGDFGTGLAIDDQEAVTSPQIAGTPLYLAPEIFEGQPATIASDLYSVGVLLYYLVTGNYPVRGGTLAEVRRAHAAGERVPLRSINDRLPDAFVGIVEGLLAPDRQLRFPAASAVASALTASVATSTRRRWAVGVAAVVALVAIGAGVVLQMGRARDTVQSIAAPASATVLAGDWIFVASFDNQTGETALDGAIDAALKRELEYSEHVRVAQRDRWEDALRLLGKPLDTRLDASLARQVSVLDGSIKRVVTGSITRDGRRYTVTSHIVDPGSGATLATITEHAADRSQIVDAVRRETYQLRAALGEADATLAEARKGLAQVRAPSLDALSLHARALARGDVRSTPPTVAERHERWADVERLEREAIRADATFGYAWIMLAWALKNQDRSRDEYMPAARHALELTGSATPQERYFIQGSVHDLQVYVDRYSRTTNDRPELERAVAAYEALFALQPDHYYVLNNLLAAYSVLGRDRDVAHMRVRLADARPTNVVLNAQAAGDLVDSVSLEAARRYAARAEAAARLDTSGRNLIEQAYAGLTRAWLDWYGGSLQEALSRATQAEATLDKIPFQPDGVPRPRLMFLYLTLGRLKTAQAVAERSRMWDTVAPYMLAYPLKERGDRAGLRDYLQTRWTLDHWSSVTRLGWRVEFLLSAGMLDEAAQDIARYRQEFPAPSMILTAFYPYLMGQLELGRGHPAEAVRHLEPWLTGGRPEPLQNYQQPAQLLAEAWERLGHPDRAFTLLEQAVSQRPMFSSPNQFQWVTSHVQLARLYRRHGQPDKARIYEDRARALLALADSDHPLLVELNAQR